MSDPRKNQASGSASADDDGFEVVDDDDQFDVVEAPGTLVVDGEAQAFPEMPEDNREAFVRRHLAEVDRRVRDDSAKATSPYAAFLRGVERQTVGGVHRGAVEGALRKVVDAGYNLGASMAGELPPSYRDVSHQDHDALAVASSRMSEEEHPVAFGAGRVAANVPVAAGIGKAQAAVKMSNPIAQALMRAAVGAGSGIVHSGVNRALDSQEGGPVDYQLARGVRDAATDPVDVAFNVAPEVPNLLRALTRTGVWTAAQGAKHALANDADAIDAVQTMADQTPEGVARRAMAREFSRDNVLAEASREVADNITDVTKTQHNLLTEATRSNKARWVEEAIEQGAMGPSKASVARDIAEKRAYDEAIERGLYGAAQRSFVGKRSIELAGDRSVADAAKAAVRGKPRSAAQVENLFRGKIGEIEELASSASDGRTVSDKFARHLAGIEDEARAYADSIAEAGDPGKKLVLIDEYKARLDEKIKSIRSLLGVSTVREREVVGELQRGVDGIRQSLEQPDVVGEAFAGRQRRVNEAWHDSIDKTNTLRSYQVRDVGGESLIDNPYERPRVTDPGRVQSLLSKLTGRANADADIPLGNMQQALEAQSRLLPTLAREYDVSQPMMDEALRAAEVARKTRESLARYGEGFSAANQFGRAAAARVTPGVVGDPVTMRPFLGMLRHLDAPVSARVQGAAQAGKDLARASTVVPQAVVSGQRPEDSSSGAFAIDRLVTQSPELLGEYAAELVEARRKSPSDYATRIERLSQDAGFKRKLLEANAANAAR